MMKTLSTLLLFFIGFVAVAQESDSTKVRSKRNAFGFKENFTELISKPGIRNGLTQIFDDQVILAYGLYKNDKRVGRWRFFKQKDSVEQIFNYDLKKADYNQPINSISYVIDSLKEGDRVIKPVKIGGFRMAFKAIFQESHHYGIPYNSAGYDQFYIFTINERGDLEKVEEKLSSKNYNTNLTELNIKRFLNDEFRFIPAYVNGKPVKSKIVIKAKLTVS
ncbi:hypothetical protein [Pedobacter agri]|uniref:hypothetical protein n=1 Tax=Pedobacter agri TaxID=454586 RepID=UPI0027856717|nr:hypothetical protein [Pedobacter agri]MDQ1139558.1 hypothetical protein [Pedobacter agri]